MPDFKWEAKTKAGEVRKKPDLLREAAELGRRLAEEIRRKG